jgi:CRISPR-associated exonuclease Cas4
VFIDSGPLGLVTNPNSSHVDYPKQRRREEVILTPELEIEVEKILAALRLIRERPTPPVVEKPMPICKKCAYQELCWG